MMNFRNVRADRAGDAAPDINLIPLIDILLVVLIFLMLSTQFSRLTELPLRLPDAEGQVAHVDIKEIVVDITVDGRYAVDRKRLPENVTNDVQVLTEHIRNARESRKNTGNGDPKNLRLVIQADARAPHQSVMRVMDAGRRAGFVHIALAAQSETSSSGRVKAE